MFEFKQFMKCKKNMMNYNVEKNSNWLLDCVLLFNTLQIVTEFGIVLDDTNLRINMPSFDLFNPLPALDKWLCKRDRRSKQNPKFKEKDWFASVFKQDAAWASNTSNQFWCH